LRYGVLGAERERTGRSLRVVHRVTEGHWFEVTGDKRVSTPDGPSTVPEARLPHPVGVGTFAPSEILRLDPKRLREPSYSDELEPRLGPSGDGLATVLADLKLQQPARFDTIVATLEQLVPSVRNVNLHRARGDRMTQLDPQVDELGRQTQLSIIDRLVGQELRFDMPSGTDLPASVVSEGTLYLLAILTAFYSASEQTTTTNESTAAPSIRHSEGRSKWRLSVRRAIFDAVTWRR